MPANFENSAVATRLEKVSFRSNPKKRQCQRMFKLLQNCTHLTLSCIGEGNGNPLQCSCLENPRDRGAWWAAVYGVAHSRTWLKRLSSSSKVMFKILQAGLQQYVNRGLPDVQAGFRKGRGTRNQIANIHWTIKKARDFQKNIIFFVTDNAKAFDCVHRSQQTVENSSRDGNNRPPDLPPEKPVYRSRSNR